MTEVNPGKTAASSTSSPAPALGMTDHAALRRAQRNANTLLWGIFILLLVLVGGVIFILPRYVSPYVSPPEPAAAQVAATNTPAAQTPFEDAQRLRLRDDAQNALQALLTLQDQLEQQGAARWAQNPFNAALALARQGDAAYAAQDYAAAREAYQNSLA
ncbi:MAG: hypothetical protein LBF16_05590, partial [Pseudomonadales bacterium]|nr:hypothetical protein [Pseudomonadales bacterium]